MDKLQTILLPMRKTNSTSSSKRAFELTEILQTYTDKDTANYLIGAMVAVNYSQINEPEKAKILEVLKMARPFEDLYKEIRQEGIKEGIKEGLREGRKEVAKRLLLSGNEIEFIKKVTQLSDQEIDELMQNQ